jgi:hypothetical protein
MKLPLSSNSILIRSLWNFTELPPSIDVLASHELWFYYEAILGCLDFVFLSLEAFTSFPKDMAGVRLVGTDIDLFATPNTVSEFR